LNGQDDLFGDFSEPQQDLTGSNLPNMDLSVKEISTVNLNTQPQAGENLDNFGDFTEPEIQLAPQNSEIVTQSPV
jgi:hypothetical protein